MAVNSSINCAQGNLNQSSDVELWRHPAPESTQMWEFLQKINHNQGTSMKSYDELFQWSIDNVADFWAAVWDYVGIVASVPYEEVVWSPPWNCNRRMSVSAEEM